MATEPMLTQNDFLTVQEAAHALDVHPETVRTAVKQGRLPGYRVFKKLLIKKSDVEAYRVAARPDGVKTSGRPRKASSEVVEDNSAKGPAVLKSTSSGTDIQGSASSLDFHPPDSGEYDAKNTKAVWVRSTHPETGNLIYGAAKPMYTAPPIPEGPKRINLMPIIGQQIAERRRALGLSQRELAERVSISRETLSHYEVGRVQINASDLFHVAHALDVTMSFFGGNEEVEREHTEKLTIDEKEMLENYRRFGTMLKMNEIVRFRELAATERVRVETAWGLRPEALTAEEIEGEKASVDAH